MRGFWKSLFGNSRKEADEDKQEEEELAVVADDSASRDRRLDELMAIGEWAKAYELMRQMAEDAPDDIDLRLRMADVAERMGQYTTMASDCEKALLMDSGRADIYKRYARACAELGDTTNAEAMALRARMIDEKAKAAPGEASEQD